MKTKKLARCQIRMDSRWVSLSAACMGISVFLRTVYYFGLINLRDLDSFTLAMEVIVPMVLAGLYLLVVKGLQLNAPVLLGIMIGLFSINALVPNHNGTMGIVAGVLMLLLAVVYVATGLGLLPNRIAVVLLAMAVVGVRIWGVDLRNYILPLESLDLMAYLPEAAGLFSFLSVSLIAPPLSMIRRQNAASAAGGKAQEDQQPTFIDGIPLADTSMDNQPVPDQAAEDIPLPDTELDDIPVPEFESNDFSVPEAPVEAVTE